MENREDYRTTISYTIEASTKIDVPNLGNIIRENKFLFSFFIIEFVELNIQARNEYLFFECSFQ